MQEKRKKNKIQERYTDTSTLAVSFLQKSIRQDSNILKFDKIQ